MYQVLYRKYRPACFADVFGQPQVTVTLQNELQSGRISHAYLFTGSRGTGKTTCAKILAKAVNCLHPVNGDPCGECEICRGIDSGSVTDVVEIDAASNNGVDNIRTLREESNFTPAAAKYRVYIIDEVHMLSIGAFNALLKTLEEPPEHVIFILATTEVHKLPITILSRCQRFDFRRIAPEEIYARLAQVATLEGAQLEQEAGMLIARLADGALRDALSLLDQCLGKALQGDKIITQDIVSQTAGLAGRDHLYALADAVRTQDMAGALDTIDSLYRASKDMQRLCEELISHFRAMMLIKTMKDASSILAYSTQEMERLTRQAVDMTLPQILHGLDTFRDTLEHMRYAGNQRMNMEQAFLFLCSPQLDTTTQALLRRIDALERALSGAQVTVNQPVISPASPPALQPASPIAPVPPPQNEDAVPLPTDTPPENIPDKTDTTLRRLMQWPEILQEIRQYSSSVAAAFSGSSAYIKGEYVLIDAPEIAFELLRRQSGRESVRDAIRRVTGVTYKLGPYKKEEQTQQPQEDPLALLAKNAQKLGVDIQISAEEKA